MLTSVSHECCLYSTHEGDVHWLNVCKLDSAAIADYYSSMDVKERTVQWMILGCVFKLGCRGDCRQEGAGFKYEKVLIRLFPLSGSVLDEF